MRPGSVVLVQIGMILPTLLWPGALNAQQRDAAFLAGMKHYEAEEYDLAAEAFRESAGSNAFHRAARLRLLQALFGAEQWSPAVSAAEELIELDPLNGAAYVSWARSLAELGEKEEADRVFSGYQALGFEVNDLRLEEVPGEGARVRGTITTLTGEPGRDILLRFHFGGEQGQEIGLMGVRIQLPAQRESVEFQKTFGASERVVGFRYEVGR